MKEETEKKRKEAYTKTMDKKKMEEQKLIQEIQDKAKDRLIPNMVKETEKVITLILDLLEEKGAENVNNIQIMSIIAKRSLLDIAQVGNIPYTPTEVMIGFNLYLEMIEKINEIKKFPPTIESFCAFIGISSSCYNNWRADVEKKEVMEYIHSYLLGVLAVGGLTGETREISSMFLQKTMGKVEQPAPIIVEHKKVTDKSEIEAQLQALKDKNVIEADWQEVDD